MSKALCVILPFFALGCFDVETVDPGTVVEPFVVDDFEGADQLPRAPFQLWACRAFQPDDDATAVEQCAFVTDNGTTFFMGAFALHDERNGISEFEGASLGAITTRPLDLRRYSELSLSVKFFASDLVIGNALNSLYIELSCRSAPLDGTVPGPSGEVPSVIRRVTVSSSAWFSFRIPLSRFVQPPWQGGVIDGGPEACLARVDSLAFVLSTEVADGSTGRAQLYIDDVSFE